MNTAIIHITNAAQAHLVAYLSEHPENIGVRLSVKTTGCSGLAYVMRYVSVANADDLVKTLTDKYALFVDSAAYVYLKNMQVDYVKQGVNYKLVYTNPNQTGQCGCGESFTVE